MSLKKAAGSNIAEAQRTLKLMCRGAHLGRYGIGGSHWSSVLDTNCTYTSDFTDSVLFNTGKGENTEHQAHRSPWHRANSSKRDYNLLSS